MSSPKYCSGLGLPVLVGSICAVGAIRCVVVLVGTGIAVVLPDLPAAFDAFDVVLVVVVLLLLLPPSLDAVVRFELGDIVGRLLLVGIVLGSVTPGCTKDQSFECRIVYICIYILQSCSLRETRDDCLRARLHRLGKFHCCVHI